MKNMLFWCGALCLAYVALLLFMYVYQRQLLYFPHRDMKAPSAYQLEMEAISLTAEDGTRLAAWYAPPKDESLPLIVYFHGNAGHLGFRVGRFHSLLKQGFGLLALSYRGFGTSEGQPSEEGLMMDARATVRYALERTNKDQVLLMGESLGTGVAMRMASEFLVGGVVLLSPYTSIVEVAQGFYPYLPVGLLLKDRYDTLAIADRVHEPVLLVHGKRDEVVPFALGEKLAAALPSAKMMLWLDGVGHNDLPDDKISEETLVFAQRFAAAWQR